MSEISSTVSSALSSILSSEVDIGAPLSNAFMALGTAIDQLNKKHDNYQKELEQIRRMSRTNWLMVINMPLPFGQTRCQALQQLLCELDYRKPLFDAERDLLAADILHVNRNSLLCNMSFFVCQRHYDFLMSAPLQKKIVAYNQKLPKERWISIGRVLTPNERNDYELACALKRLIIIEMNQRRKLDPKYQVLFVLVCKRTMRLRIEKQYYTLEEAAAKYSIPTEAILQERNRNGNTHSSATVRGAKGANKRPAPVSVTNDPNDNNDNPNSKIVKL